MENKYKYILSPIKIGSTLFRNRLFANATGLHSLQGGEPYPTEATIDTLSNRARGGAALVTINPGFITRPYMSDGEHVSYDIFSIYNQHYLAQLVDLLHFYGAKASMEIMSGSFKMGYDVCAGIMGMDGMPSKEMTEDIMDQVADNYAAYAYVMKEIGCDMVLIHMGYRMSPEARFLSPATNRRTDKYGGSVENRARFPIIIFDRIKQKCGKDFLIELRMSGIESDPNGITIEDSMKLAKLLEGHIDLIQVHSGSGNPAVGHCLDFFPPEPNLAAAEAIKKSGTRLAVGTVGGYQELDEAEEVIASEKADIISMARGWIADPDLGVKAYEGRGEDVVPCIKCNRCHDSGCLEHRTFVCSVNPAIGIEHRLEKVVKPPVKVKKIAVVGGGPAGMQAALIAFERGHDVTLYEKGNILGGQLVFADHVYFKRSLNKFKQYLISRVAKSRIKVLVNTRAAPTLLENGNYDVVIAALGAEPLIPDIPGIRRQNVVTAPAVYGNEVSLDSKVVVVGGGQVGCETALHLAKEGHDVTLIEMQEALAAEASFIYRVGLIGQIESSKNLRYLLNARCVNIGDSVDYVDINGTTKSIKAGSIVVAAGMKSNIDEAMSFVNASRQFFAVGDCYAIGNVQKAMRTAFAVSIML